MIYSCKMCNAHLSDRDHLTSKNFSGRSGQAYLFSEVYNVYVGKKDKETLQTGNYIVRKVFCLKCREYNNTRTRVGWTYPLEVHLIVVFILSGLVGRILGETMVRYTQPTQ